MLDLFNELLDSLNWEGYAMMLYSTNPDKYAFELEEFKRAYN